MKYSKELIEEVKSLYPNYSAMIKLAEDGNRFLGRYLCDSTPSGITADEILFANSLDDLKRRAKLIKRKSDLYQKWSEEEYSNQKIPN